MKSLRHLIICTCALAITLQGTFTFADESASGPLQPAKARLVIIAGHPGDEEHAKMWNEVADRLRTCFRDHLGVADSRIDEWRGKEQQQAEGNHHGAATYELLRQDLADLALQTSEDEELWVVVLAHAHGIGRSTFLNLPGPDITPDEFANLFRSFKCRRKVFLLTNPLSGAFCGPLSHRSHILVAAADQDEPNATYFAESFVEALDDAYDSMASPFSEVSLLELVEATARKIRARYTSADFIVTEHIQIDDNGDNRVTELQLPQDDDLVVRPTEQGKADGGVIATVIFKFGADK